MRRVTLALLLMAVGVAACGDDDGSATAAGASQDPYGLWSVEMPATDGEILGVFNRMPEEISGIPRLPSGDALLIRQYGELNTIVGIRFPVQEGDGGPETLADDLAQFELEAGAVVEGSHLDPSSSLVWLIGSFPDQGGAGLVHLVVWGEPDGDWAFNVSAESAAMRDAIVRAFVDAVGQGG